MCLYMHVCVHVSRCSWCTHTHTHSIASCILRVNDAQCTLLYVRVCHTCLVWLTYLSTCAPASRLAHMQVSSAHARMSVYVHAANVCMHASLTSPAKQHVAFHLCGGQEIDSAKGFAVKRDTKDSL